MNDWTTWMKPRNEFNIFEHIFSYVLHNFKISLKIVYPFIFTIPSNNVIFCATPPPPTVVLATGNQRENVSTICITLFIYTGINRLCYIPFEEKTWNLSTNCTCIGLNAKTVMQNDYK
jgi:hypothetical protein